MRYPCNLFGKPAGRWPLSSDPLPVERWRRERKRPPGFDEAEQMETARIQSSARLGSGWVAKHY